MSGLSLPEWAKVKIAAVAGIGTPILGSLVEHAGPIVELCIKLGQFGVTVATFLYIFVKWRNARRDGKNNK